jgi:small nuclear ribonucleoprotein F
VLERRLQLECQWGASRQREATRSPTQVQLGDAKEYIDGQLAGALGEILIRCNNVMYMREAPAGDAAMEE